MGAWRHVRAIGLLPFAATVVVPALILAGGDVDVAQAPLAVLGVVLIAAGLATFVWTVSLLARLGRGTLAPWDPTSRLVVAGPYRYVRNPMITAVLSVLLGEAALFGSTGILVWAGVFFAANLAWFPLVEEPGLVRRFGADYEAYRAEVPRWLPRLTPRRRSPPPPSSR
jgi:protein-S-isoprenylcysteine O-methyltransferase Ste14